MTLKTYFFHPPVFAHPQLLSFKYFQAFKSEWFFQFASAICEREINAFLINSWIQYIDLAKQANNLIKRSNKLFRFSYASAFFFVNLKWLIAALPETDAVNLGNVDAFQLRRKRYFLSMWNAHNKLHLKIEKMFAVSPFFVDCHIFISRKYNLK